MGERKTAAKAVLTLMSLMSIGMVIAGASYLIWFFKKIDMDDIAKDWWIGVITALICACLLLILAIYCTCWGGRCCKALLAAIFVLFGLGLIGVAIGVLAYRSKFVEFIGLAFNESENTTLRLERVFKCEGWDGNETCEGKFDRNFRSWSVPLSVVAIVCGFVVVGLSVIVYRLMYHHEGDSFSEDKDIEDARVGSRHSAVRKDLGADAYTW